MHLKKGSRTQLLKLLTFFRIPPAAMKLWCQHILNSNDDDERRYNLINQLRDCANILFFLECTGLLGMKGRYLLTRSGSSWVEIREEGVCFKMVFQICNVEHPNSPVNTCAFCVFEAPEAPDNVTNLKIALQRFEDEVDSLQSKTWRY